MGVHRQAFPLPPSNVEFDKSLLAPPKTTLTQLSNGVKAILLLRTSAQTASFGADFGSFQVASEDGGGHIGGVGVFVDAGSRLEGNQYMGATHFLQVTEYRTPTATPRYTYLPQAVSQRPRLHKPQCAGTW